MSKFKKHLINRINQLKEERKKFENDIHLNKNSQIRMNINEKTKKFYEYTYDILITELENALNLK